MDVKLKTKKIIARFFTSRIRTPGYCFKKCVSNKRKKSTDFLDLQEIKTTKTKKV